MLKPNTITQGHSTQSTREADQAPTRCTPTNHGTMDVNSECGSFVRVRSSGILWKGQSKFPAPLQVMEKRGSHVYKLSDGWIWNTSHVEMACQGNAGDNAEQPLLADHRTTSTMHMRTCAGKWDARIRTPPVWTQLCDGSGQIWEHVPEQCFAVSTFHRYSRSPCLAASQADA